jgi:hypothetical protein
VGIRGILLKFRSSVLCFASHCRGRTLPTINHYSSFGGLKLAILIVGDFNNSEIDGRNSFRLTIRRSTSNSVCIAIRAYRSCMWQFKKKKTKNKNFNMKKAWNFAIAFSKQTKVRCVCIFAGYFWTWKNRRKSVDH